MKTVNILRASKIPTTLKCQENLKFEENSSIRNLYVYILSDSYKLPATVLFLLLLPIMHHFK